MKGGGLGCVLGRGGRRALNVATDKDRRRIEHFLFLQGMRGQPVAEADMVFAPGLFSRLPEHGQRVADRAGATRRR